MFSINAWMDGALHIFVREFRTGREIAHPVTKMKIYPEFDLVAA